MRAAGRSVVRLPGHWSLHRRHRSTEVDNDVRSSGTSKAFTIFTRTKMHLVYPPPPQKKKQKKLCITIVFDFSKDDCNTLENSEGETRCIIVYMKVVITRGRDVKR